MSTRSRGLHQHGRSALAVLLLYAIAWTQPAIAQEEHLESAQIGETPAEQGAPAGAESAAAEKARQERIRSIEQRLLATQQVLRGLQNELMALKGGPAPSVAPAPTSPTAAPTVAPTPPRTAQAPQAPAGGAAPAAPTAETGSLAEEEAVSPEQELPSFTPGVLREARAVLIPEGLLEIDPRLRYEFSRRDVIDVSGVNIVEAIFVGTFRVGEITRNSITPSLNFRYGYSRDLQFNLSVPYTWVRRETVLPDTVQNVISDAFFDTTTNSALGDVNFGLSYHLWKESDLLPDLILSANVKSNTGKGPFDVGLNESSTGTGFWGGSIGLTAVKVSDPGVMYANVGYFYHQKDRIRGFDFDPPDSIDWGGGYSWAMNPFLNLTTRVEGRFVQRTKVNGQDIRGSDLTIANLGLGLTYAYSPTGSLDLFLQFGLTDDSPDFAFVLSRPFQFDFDNLLDEIF